MSKRIHERFHSQGRETHHSSFPHRTVRKEGPSIGDKMIPVHKMNIHRGYKGNTMNVTTFDHWAYVPPAINSRQIEKMYCQFHIKSRKASKQMPHEINRDRSQLAIKKFFKRKEQMDKKEPIYYSQIINLKQKEALFGRTTAKYFYHSQSTQPSSEPTFQNKKDHLKTRLKQSWGFKRQKIMEHLRQSLNSSNASKAQLKPPRYTHLPRDGKGFLINDVEEYEIGHGFVEYDSAN